MRIREDVHNCEYMKERKGEKMAKKELYKAIKRADKTKKELIKPTKKPKRPTKNKCPYDY